MASQSLFLLVLPLMIMRFIGIFATPLMYPFHCTTLNKSCKSILYQSNGLQLEKIEVFYSVKKSEIQPINHANGQDYLITVPCACTEHNGTTAFFYDTEYLVRKNDTFVNVSGLTYSGQAWKVGGEEKSFISGREVPIHLLCGCVESDSQTVITYTVQEHDTLSDIGIRLSAHVSEIQDLNRYLIQNSSFIDVGWVLFVPRENNGIPSGHEGKEHKWTILIGILSALTLLSVCTLTTILIRRRRSQDNIEKHPKDITKNLSTIKSFSAQKQYLHGQTMEDIPVFESERPVIYSLEEIAEATNNFDEARIIGKGGYGSVYFGEIREQEVAIKKMRSNKSKEFLAELKVLCKIHHINVVELLGYASGDDHLYLVYEYIPNGSLSDHLHDPLLKGHQPLSWTARTQIAVDAAMGIEYIHDHTKARYVHRDIKTSNILLDEGLRAKVADFGLVKLVGRSNEDELIATRLVGTPGYLPPESVKELQVTTKTDVFAFGVVLAELITGRRALFRDNKEEPIKMKSLITLVTNVFQDEHPEAALDSVIDGNLKGNYPVEDVYKMAEIAYWCLSEEPLDRPEMREIVVELSKLMASSVEWEASLGGNSQVFSGVFNGR